MNFIPEGPNHEARARGRGTVRAGSRDGAAQRGQNLRDQEPSDDGDVANVALTRCPDDAMRGQLVNDR